MKLASLDLRPEQERIRSGWLGSESKLIINRKF